MYVAKSVWPEFLEHFKKETEVLKVGDVEDYGNFMNPVIHECSFDKLDRFMQHANTDMELDLIVGGKACKENIYYVCLMVYHTSNPQHEIMSRELFGPILGVYVYPDSQWEETLKLIDTTSRYGLTGNSHHQGGVCAVRQGGLPFTRGLRLVVLSDMRKNVLFLHLSELHIGKETLHTIQT